METFIVVVVVTVALICVVGGFVRNARSHPGGGCGGNCSGCSRK